MDVQMFSVLQHLKQVALQKGCYEVAPSPRSTLTNRIHPLFALDRWVRGYDQYSSQLFPTMVPALQMASLMLTEDCTLPWFAHLKHGARRVEDTRVVLAWTHPSTSQAGIDDARTSLVRMAKTTSIMFVPRKYQNTRLGRGSGCATRFKEDLSWYTEFKNRDWPSVSHYYRDSKRRPVALPVICLNVAFQDLLREFDKATYSEQYRISFMLATTLLHEVAHAYWYFLGRYKKENFPDEPCWDTRDRENELGFSFENTFFGRILDPLGSIEGLRCAEVLLSLQSVSFSHRQDRDQVVRKFFDDTQNLNWITINVPPSTTNISTSDWRANSWYHKDGIAADVYTVSIIHAVPMWWIHQWFNHDEWEKRRQMWREHGVYQAPGLGEALVVVCQRNPGVQQPWLAYCTNTAVDPNLEAMALQAARIGAYRP